MSYYKKLIGDRLYLSPLNINDEVIEKYTKWINDLETSILLIGFSDVYTENKEKEILEKHINNENEKIFAIIDKETDELIGDCALHEINMKNKHATLGIFIGNKNYWDKGYGTESIELLLSYAFYFLNLHNINLEVLSYNKRAIKCYKNIGFKEIGRRRESVILGNKYYDHIYMDILSEEFKGKYEGFIENFNEVN